MLPAGARGTVLLKIFILWSVRDVFRYLTKNRWLYYNRDFCQHYKMEGVSNRSSVAKRMAVFLIDSLLLRKSCVSLRGLYLIIRLLQPTKAYVLTTITLFKIAVRVSQHTVPIHLRAA